jgi:hypothetical protein
MKQFLEVKNIFQKIHETFSKIMNQKYNSGTNLNGIKNFKNCFFVVKRELF